MFFNKRANQQQQVDPGAQGQQKMDDPPKVGDPGGQQQQQQPQFVTLDQLNQFKTEFLDTLRTGAQFGGGGGQRSQQTSQQRSELPPIEDVPEEAFQKALRDGGEGAAQIVSKRMAANNERLRRDMNQQFQQLQTTGLGAIAGLTKQQLASRPYYARFKKEIDDMVGTLSPEAQINAEALDAVYNLVVGRHAADLIEESKQVTAAELAKTQDIPAAGTRFRDSKGNEIPKPEDVLPAQALDAIRHRGQTPDEYYRARGYNGWAGYYEDHKDFIGS